MLTCHKLASLQTQAGYFPVGPASLLDSASSNMQPLHSSFKHLRYLRKFWRMPEAILRTRNWFLASSILGGVIDP